MNDWMNGIEIFLSFTFSFSLSQQLSTADRSTVTVVARQELQSQFKDGLKGPNCASLSFQSLYCLFLNWSRSLSLGPAQNEMNQLKKEKKDEGFTRCCYIAKMLAFWKLLKPNFVVEAPLLIFSPRTASNSQTRCWKNLVTNSKKTGWVRQQQSFDEEEREVKKPNCVV